MPNIETRIHGGCNANGVLIRMFNDLASTIFPLNAHNHYSLFITTTTTHRVRRYEGEE
jgi:hypothetical protein